jgi:hypothetical protein
VILVATDACLHTRRGSWLLPIMWSSAVMSSVRGSFTPITDEETTVEFDDPDPTSIRIRVVLKITAPL